MKNQVFQENIGKEKGQLSCDNELDPSEFKGQDSFSQKLGHEQLNSSQV